MIMIMIGNIDRMQTKLLAEATLFLPVNVPPFQCWLFERVNLLYKTFPSPAS